MRKSRKIMIVAGAFAGAAGLGVAAFAFWTTGGSGTGSGATGTTANITVNQTSASSDLYPGGSVALSGDFTNTTNPGTVTITSVTATIDTFSYQTAFPLLPACTEADFSISGTSTIGGPVPNGTNVGSWSGLSLNMTNDLLDNQNNCKNVTVPITYTAA